MKQSSKTVRFLTVMLATLIAFSAAFTVLGNSVVAHAETNRDYTITFKTCDAVGSGTDNNVGVMFVGTNGSDTGWKTLDNGVFYNDFEAGSLDTYTVNRKDVGTIRYIKIFHDTQYGSWACEYMEFEGERYDMTRFGAFSGKISVRIDVTAGVTYVSDLAFACDDESSSCKNWLSTNSYTCIDYDLNKGAGGDYVYAGYKTSSKPYEGITGIVAFYQQDTVAGHKLPAEYKVYNNCTYKRVGGYDLDDDESLDAVDLNKGIAGGFILAEYVYIYVTYDFKAGEPITELSVDSNNRIGGWNTVGKEATNTAMDLNKGVGGDYIYLHYKRVDGAINSVGSIFGEYSWAFIIGGCVIFVAAVAVVLVVVLKRRNKAKAAKSE